MIRSGLFRTITDEDWKVRLKDARAQPNIAWEQIKQQLAMNNNLTDITIVIDRSGSMQTIKNDTIGGFNTFLKDQQETPGQATFSLHQFDDLFETVIDARPIAEVKPLDSKTYVPRGSTALLDAVGRSINSTGERLAKMEEKDRPGKVVFVIITDGEENASKEFTLSKVKSMIKLQQETYKWQFVFLGANIDAVSVGAGLGVPISNAMKFAANPIGTQSLYADTTANLKAFRTNTKLDMSYTLDQHAKQKKAGA